MAAQYETAFNFMMDNEDSTRAGRVTPDPSVDFPNAVARFGVNSGANPEAALDNFYTMPLPDALEWAASFYRTMYWEPLLLPQVNDQLVANKIFDLGVNEGRTEITKITQRAVNWINPTLIVDGNMGAKTLTSVNASDPLILLEQIKSYAAQFYQAWAFRTKQPAGILQAMLNRVNK